MMALVHAVGTVAMLSRGARSVPGPPP